MYPPKHDILFSFGENDIIVLKKDIENVEKEVDKQRGSRIVKVKEKQTSSCYQKSFDYQMKKNVLVGELGRLSTVPFTPVRILVIDMNSSKVSKDKKSSKSENIPPVVQSSI